MISQTFSIGDAVNILSAAHLPREVVTNTGTIERITHQTSDGTPLYWVSGRRAAVTAVQLRAAIPYTPDTWTPDQLAAHRADDLDAAFAVASRLAGGWYRRAVTIDWQVTPENTERYMVRPSEIAALDGWQPCYEVKAVSA